MRTVTMRCITAAALSVYLLLTVGVEVRVCGCCGSMDLSILWKMMDACGTCCQTDVYVMDAAFCPMTEDFSEADFHLFLADSFIPVPAGWTDDSGLYITSGVFLLSETAPPGVIYLRIEQLRL